jgi:V8-like Glu-specific endopeptidase
MLRELEQELERELEGELELEGEQELEGELEQQEAELESELEFEGESELEQEFETQPGQEVEVLGRDERVQVTRAEINRAPFRYICNLEMDVPGVGARAMCSGTLIGPRTVLTAGHCIAGKRASLFRVIPGRFGMLEPFPATRAAAVHVMPGFAPVSPTDIGIIHLQHPVGATMGYWSRTYRRLAWDDRGTSIGRLPLPPGNIAVNLSGYPADKPDDPRFGCRVPGGGPCRHSSLSGRTRQRVCGTFQWRSYNQTAVRNGDLLRYMNDTCAGHSGSPVWVKRDKTMGGRVMVAVHLGAAGRHNVGACLTPRVMAFVMRHLR